MKVKIKILLSLLQLMLTMYILTMAVSLAWFVKIDKNNVNGFSTTLVTPTTDIQCKIYNVENDALVITDQIGSLVLSLPQYDLFIPEKNNNIALLVVFVLTDETAATWQNGLTITLFRQPANGYNMSAVTEYSAKALSTLPIDVADYKQLSEDLHSTATIFEADYINLSITAEDCLSAGVSGNLSLVLYINYSKDLIDSNFADVGVQTETDGGYIAFKNDLVEVLIH